MDERSRHAALGYAIMTAERLGWNKKLIEQLVRGMKVRFVLKSQEEALGHYFQSVYSGQLGDRTIAEGEEEEACSLKQGNG